MFDKIINTLLLSLQQIWFYKFSKVQIQSILVYFEFSHPLYPGLECYVSRITCILA